MAPPGAQLAPGRALGFPSKGRRSRRRSRPGAAGNRPGAAAGRSVAGEPPVRFVELLAQPLHLGLGAARPRERKLRIVSVDVASSDRERALIQTGLSNGDRVITSPVRSPADGMEVKPVDDPSKVISQQLIASAETTQRED